MTTQTDSIRAAIIRGGDADRVANYLPANYRVDSTTPDGVLIIGTDNAGWTLDDYVLPRFGVRSDVRHRSRPLTNPNPQKDRTMPDNQTFTQWMADLDAIVTAAIGLTSGDLGDAPYRDRFDDEVDPLEAAAEFAYDYWELPGDIADDIAAAAACDDDYATRGEAADWGIG